MLGSVAVAQQAQSLDGWYEDETTECVQAQSFYRGSRFCRKRVRCDVAYQLCERAMVGICDYSGHHYGHVRSRASGPF